MQYKSILTVITRKDDARPAIAAAARLAREWDGHLDVLVLGVDRVQLGYSYMGAAEVLVQASLQRLEAETRALESEVAAVLRSEGQDLRFAQETIVTQMGVLPEVVGGRARFADLVVLARPYGADRGAEAEAVVEAALFEGRVPVLVLPDKPLEGVFGRRVLLAWNQSNESLVAARAALPLLVAAEDVDITVVDPPTQGPERSDPGGLLCQMLVRHGVKAEVSVLAKNLPRVSDVLARHVWDTNADLIVMGAYGHSRLREAVLGGATRNMLEKADVPVLMAH